MPILCVDEAYSLLQRLTYQGKSTSQMSLSMERLCKCYDGDFWYVMKGTKGKRVGVTSAKLALLAFTTPQQFLESVWPKIVSSKNGLAERILFFYQRRSEDLDLEAMAENPDSLDEFAVKSLGDVFEKMGACEPILETMLLLLEWIPNDDSGKCIVANVWRTKKVWV